MVFSVSAIADLESHRDDASALRPTAGRSNRNDFLDAFRQQGNQAFFNYSGNERLPGLRKAFEATHKFFSGKSTAQLIEDFKPGAKRTPELDQLDKLMKDTRYNWNVILKMARQNELGGMAREDAFRKAIRSAASKDELTDAAGKALDQFASALMIDPEDLLNELAKFEKTPPKTEAERQRLMGLLLAHRFYLTNGGKKISDLAGISQRSAILLMFGAKGSDEVKSAAKVLIAKLPQLAARKRFEVLRTLSLQVSFGESSNQVLYGNSDPSRLPGDKYGNALLFEHALKKFASDPVNAELLRAGQNPDLNELLTDLLRNSLPDVPRGFDPRAVADGAQHLRDNLARGLSRVKGRGDAGDKEFAEADKAFDDALDAVDGHRDSAEGRKNRDRSESELLVDVPEWLCAVAVARASRGAVPSESIRSQCQKEFRSAGVPLPPPTAKPSPSPVNLAGGADSATAGNAGSTKTDDATSVASGGAARPGAPSSPGVAITGGGATDGNRLDGSAFNLFSRRNESTPAKPALPPAQPVQGPPAPAAVAAAPAPAVTTAPVSVASPPAVAAAAPASAAGNDLRAGSKPAPDDSHSTNSSDDHDGLPPSLASADDSHHPNKGARARTNTDNERVETAENNPVTRVRQDNGSRLESASSPVSTASNGASAPAESESSKGGGATSTTFINTSSFWPTQDFTLPSASSSPGPKVAVAGSGGASEENGWKSGMMPMPGTLKMPRPLYLPERGANLLWRERNGFEPRPGEEAIRFNATDLRRSALAAGMLDLPGTAPVAMNDLGPARETIFARKNDLLLGQAEFLLGKNNGLLPDGRKIEVLRVAEIDPGVREDDPKSLLGRIVKRRTVIKLTERDGTTKTFTTTFDERYVPGPTGKPMPVKLAERIDVLEEARGQAPVRRRIERSFVLGADGKPVQVASNEMLLGKDGNPIRTREDKVVLSTGTAKAEKRRSTTFYDVDDWKKRVYELDRTISGK